MLLYFTKNLLFSSPAFHYWWARIRFFYETRQVRENITAKEIIRLEQVSRNAMQEGARNMLS
jgi:hypothetical protein